MFICTYGLHHFSFRHNYSFKTQFIDNTINCSLSLSSRQKLLISYKHELVTSMRTNIISRTAHSNCPTSNNNNVTQADWCCTAHSNCPTSHNNNVTQADWYSRFAEIEVHFTLILFLTCLKFQQNLRIISQLSNQA